MSTPQDRSAPHGGTQQLLQIMAAALPPASPLQAAAAPQARSAMSASFSAAGPADPAAAANTAATTQELQIPANVIDWLAQLVLLYGVPFEYLVPDSAMLPNESIRFFYVDQNWTNRLVDGAVHIALGSTQDYVHILTTFEQLAQQAALAAAGVRPQLRNKPPASSQESVATQSGLLLCSAAVSGWPGMEISAYADLDQKQPLTLLRMDRLSDNVLLCLFNGVPKLVVCSEPPEGLHFGVQRNTGSSNIGPIAPGQYYTTLRGLGGKYPAGSQIQEGGQAALAPLTLRSGSTSVLNVTQCAATQYQRLQALGAISAATPFSSAPFAVQMVKGAGLQQFRYDTPNTNTVNA